MMKKIKIEDLKPGMRFTRAVYITPANMLVGAHMPVKEEDIKKLVKWGIKEVQTAGEIIPGSATKVDYSFTEKDSKLYLKEKLIDEYRKLHKNKNKFKGIYDKIVDKIRRVVFNVKYRKYIEYSNLHNIASELIGEVISNPHIYIYMASNFSDEEDYLSYHQVNVAIFTLVIAKHLKIETKKLMNLTIGSLLLDIGMTKVPKSILEKKEKLTSKELIMIKLHPIYGYKILAKDSGFPAEVANIALQHHEQFDGNGYPRKLKGEQIDFNARIVSIADTYEAMTKKRSYRDEFISYEAMRSLLGSSKNKFDPKILRAFLSNMSIYPIASLVKLNTNAIGMVIGAYPDKPLRPIIKIIIDEFGDKVPEDEERIIDLSEEKHIYIVSAINEKELGIKTFDFI